MSERLRVFYSWQSDLPAQINERLIRNALNQTKAQCDANGELDIVLQVDEATRNEPGAPNIKDAIFRKIKEADVFIADISVVGETAQRDFCKKLCNPNVAIELGYAIAELGWSRIVLVFNSAYGEVPGDMPFDTGGHRATAYCLSQDELSSNPGLEGSRTAELKNAFVQTVTNILQQCPPKARDEGVKTEEDIRHGRDVEQLKRVFQWINVSSINRLLSRLGFGRVPSESISMHECLELVIDGVSFHLYDQNADRLIREYRTSFEPIWEQLSYMSHQGSTDEMRFEMPGDMFTSREQAQAYEIVCATELQIRNSLRALLDHIRNNYMEINTDETGTEAVNQYRAIHRSGLEQP